MLIVEPPKKEDTATAGHTAVTTTHSPSTSSSHNKLDYVAEALHITSLCILTLFMAEVS